MSMQIKIAVQVLGAQAGPASVTEVYVFSFRENIFTIYPKH